MNNKNEKSGRFWASAHKGFSLVELIVVVAIMAILVGVMAPSFTGYVDRARRQTCYSNMDAIVSNVQITAFANPSFMSALFSAAQTSTTDLKEFVNSNADVKIPSCPAHGEYTLVFDKATGILTMTCTMDEHDEPAQGEIEGVE